MKFCYLLSLASQAKFTSTAVVPKFLYYSVGNWRSRLSLQNRVYPDFCELQEPQRLLLCSALHIRMSLHDSRLTFRSELGDCVYKAARAPREALGLKFCKPPAWFRSCPMYLSSWKEGHVCKIWALILAYFYFESSQAGCGGLVWATWSAWL